LTGKFDLANVNNTAFYISRPKLLFETTEISTRPNSTQQEWNYIYLYTTKFGYSIKIRLNRKFESTEFETMRVNCISLYDYNYAKIQTNLDICHLVSSHLKNMFYIYIYIYNNDSDLKSTHYISFNFSNKNLWWSSRGSQFIQERAIKNLLP
jgi:hypothetical protein